MYHLKDRFTEIASVITAFNANLQAVEQLFVDVADALSDSSNMLKELFDESILNFNNVVSELRCFCLPVEIYVMMLILILFCVCIAAWPRAILFR